MRECDLRHAGFDISGGLDGFWQNSHQAKPDNLLYQRFNGYLVRHTQLNGSFYKRLPVIASVAGLRWMLKIDTDATQQPVDSKEKAVLREIK